MIKEKAGKPLSAQKIGTDITFTVWAPEKEKMILHIVHPVDEKHPMLKDEEGYWQVTVPDPGGDVKYFFMPGGEKDYPDPASRYQPEGVHGPSQVIDHTTYRWQDEGWKGIPLGEYILYELHVGTFTPEGSFDAVIPRLDDLKRCGINAIEIMPVAQFPGERNWGYDGVYPYAVQHSYGGPEGLKRLVDACHQKGIAVVLDVVYNHQGPEGNYLGVYAEYFSKRYHTLWGDAINFDWEWSDGVRHFYAQNTLYWLREFHIDALRFDAIHAIFDFSPVHIWEYIHTQVKELEQEVGRRFYLIAESDLNDPRALDGTEKRGFGFDAQWLDDFHHALYKILYKADKDRYNDFGHISQLAKAFKNGFVHAGDEFVKTRKRSYGASSEGYPGDKFVVFNVNHDQIGNRPDGARLSTLVDFERAKLAAATTLLSPYIPMLYMGEEYADDTPFYYFVSHTDEGLIEAVRKGRKEEFKDAGFNTEPPDAFAEQTFRDSVINWEKRKEGKHQVMLEWYTELIHLRRTKAALKNFDKADLEATTFGDEALAVVRRAKYDQQVICLFNFAETEASFTADAAMGNLKKILASKEPKWLVQKEESEPLAERVEAGGTIIVPPLGVLVYEAE